jgi:hypothetical protein
MFIDFGLMNVSLSRSSFTFGMVVAQILSMNIIFGGMNNPLSGQM